MLLMAASDSWSRMTSSYGFRTFILRSRSADILTCCAAEKTMSFTGCCVTSISNRCSIKICANGKLTPGNRSASTSSPKKGHFIFPSTFVSTLIFLTPRSRLPCCGNRQNPSRAKSNCFFDVWNVEGLNRSVCFHVWIVLNFRTPGWDMYSMWSSSPGVTLCI